MASLPCPALPHVTCLTLQVALAVLCMRTTRARQTSTILRSQRGTLAPCSPLKCSFMMSTVMADDNESRKMVAPKNWPVVERETMVGCSSFTLWQHLKRNQNDNADVNDEWKWRGTSVVFTPVRHVLLTGWWLCMFVNFPSDKTFTFKLIATCRDSFCYCHSSHLHWNVWKYSKTNSMFSIFLSHSHLSFPFALCTSGISA